MKKALLNRMLSGFMLLVTSTAWANWSIDNEFSRVSFVSVKNEVIGEAHHFTQIDGELKNNGEFQFEIPLASVETMIPIRNSRMQKMLFETNKFATAMISGKVKPADLKLKLGQSKFVDAQVDLGLHGVNAIVMSQVMLTKIAKDKLQVVSTKPIIVNPATFGLDNGIKKLQAVAKLANITQSVPVSFVLTFKKNR